jgi:hypothetical protein
MLGDKDVRQRKPPAPQPQFADFPRNEQLSFSSEFWHWLSWPYLYIYIYTYIYNYSNLVTHEHKHTRSKWPTHISSPIRTVAVYVYIGNIGITASSFKCHRCWNMLKFYPAWVQTHCTVSWGLSWAAAKAKGCCAFGVSPMKINE